MLFRSTVTVAGAEDSVLESNETFTLTVGTQTATGTIENDDAKPTINAIADVSEEEGDALAFDVTLSNTADTAQTYAFSLTDNETDSTDYGNVTFSNGVTYDAATGLITVPANVADFTVTVAGAEDSVLESNETFTLTVGTQTATGTIENDDAKPTINAIADVSEEEGDALAFDVTLSNTADTAQTYAFSLTDNETDSTDYGNVTFSNGVTYDAATGLITVPANVADFTVTVAGAEDSVLESNETFTLTVGTQTATGTIENDDAKPTINAIADVSEEEGDALAFDVTLSNTADTAQTYAFSLTDNETDSTDYGNVTFSNGVTYDAATGLITVPANVADFTVTVAGAEDSVLESNETFTLTVGTQTATGTIENDDAKPTINAIADVSEEEGDALAFDVTLSNTADTAQTYAFSLTDNETDSTDYGNVTFSNGVTYDAATGLITVPANVADFTVTVAGAEDSVLESNETFTLTVGTQTATGTIENDDAKPTINAIADVSEEEGDALAFDVTLSNTADTAQTYAFSLTDNETDSTDYGNVTFSNGVTYDAATGLITVPANVADFTVTVAGAEDSVLESNETFTLTVGTQTATGTIENDDAKPTINAIADVSEEEGDALAFDVTLSNTADTAQTYAFSLTDNETDSTDYGNVTFSNGVTYDAATGLITVPANVADFTVTVAGAEDSVLESNETFTLTVGTQTATGTIENDDAKPTINAIADVSEEEGDALAFDVTLSNTADTAQTYAFSLTDNETDSTDYGNVTFSNGVTYDAATGLITVPANVADFTVTVAGAEDSVLESNETFTLTVGTQTATGTIENDDAKPTINAIADVSEEEGDALAFDVTLSNTADTAQTYAFSLTDNETDSTDYGNVTFSNGVTYDAATGLITVPANVADFTVTVAGAEDSVLESNETFTLTVGTQTATGTIENDDAKPTINAIADVSEEEGDALAFDVTLSNTADTAQTYAFSLTDNETDSTDYGNVTFSNGVTYDAATGLITVPANVADFTVTVAGAEDSVLESNETFTLTVGTQTATGTIENDDAKPTINAIADVSEEEGDALAFDVTLSNTADTAQTYAFSLTDNETDSTDYGNVTFSNGVTYDAATGLITVPANVADFTVTVAGAEDSVLESNETFTLTVGTQTATGTIENDDAKPTINAIADVSEEEGDALAFDVTLSNTADTAQTYAFSLTDNETDSTDYGNVTFSNGVTYDAATGLITVPANVADFTVTVAGAEDSVLESNETFTLTVGTQTATGTIENDDAKPTINAIADVSEEEGDALAFDVTLSNTADTAQTYAFSLTDNETDSTDYGNVTFSNGVTYDAATGLITVPANVADFTVTVAGAEDSVLESNETFTLTVGTQTATGTIENDDAKPTINAIADVSEEEGDALAFDVTLSNTADTAQTYAFSLTDNETDSTDYGNVTFSNGVTYDAATGLITVPANVADFTVTVAGAEDSVLESNETFTLTVGTQTATGTIENDDAKPTINAIADVSEEEGDALAFDVTLSNTADTAQTYAFSLTDNETDSTDYGNVTFSNGVTYDAATGLITVPANVADFTVTVAGAEDSVLESNETFTLTVGTQTATGTIENDDAKPTINAIADVSEEEGDALAFDVTLSNTADTAQTYAFSLTDNETDSTDYGNVTFSNGVTYDAATGLITVPANVADFTVTVAGAEDSVLESNETFTLTVGTQTATGTIENDDAKPTINAIADVSEEEGDALAFDVTLSNTADTAQTYAFSLTDNETDSTDYGNVTFSNGVTYDAATGLITVPANVADFTVTVAGAEDSVLESNETFTLTVGTQTATGTIENDDAKPTINAIADVSEEEGDALAFDVTLSNTADTAQTYAFSLTDNETDSTDYGNVTFSNGVTYDAATGLITVPANVADFTVTVAGAEDSVLESNETFTLTVGTQTATGTIENDDAKPTINAIADVSEEEGDALAFDVTLSNTADTAQTYAFSLTDNETDSTDYGNVTFSNGVTYDAATGLITVPANVADFTVTVAGAEDSVLESNETFTLTVGTQTATGTIENDDAKPTINAIADVSEEEGDALAFDVTLSNTADTAQTYAFSLTDNETDSTDYGNVTFSNGVTYDAATGLITVPANVADFTVTVAGAEDSVLESNETFTLTVGTQTATGTIENDDAKPTINAIADVSEEEGDALAFDVTLSNTADTAQTYAFSLTDNETDSTDYGNVTFSNGVTYDAATGLITVPANVADFTVTVAGAEDSVLESNETFTLTVGTQTATGTIENDDAKPTINAIADVSEEEGDALAFDVTLSNTADTAQTYAFSLTDNETDSTDYGNVTFSNGVTYDAATGLITVPANVADFTVTVAGAEDSVLESNETFTLTVGTQTATGTIENDDAKPTINAIADVSEEEGDALAFDVTLSNTADTAQTYAFSLTDNETDSTDYGNVTFSNGVTYDAATGLITVPANVADFTVTVAGAEDSVLESNETFTLTVGTQTATGTIENDDAKPTINAIADVSEEEGDALAFDVTLSNTADTAQTYAFSLTDNETDSTDYGNVTFSNGVTYDAATGLITVPANVADFTVTVAGAEDSVLESNETFTLTVGTQTATGTIENDDAKPTINAIADVSEEEGDALAFDVTLSNTADTAQTYAFSLTDNETDSTDYGNVTFSNGVTYDAATGLITVPANVADFTVTVAGAEDSVLESNETFTLTVGTQTATGTIENDDAKPTINAIADVSEEEGDALAFDVTLSNTADTAQTYAFSLTDNETDSTDYGNVTFSNGVTYDAATGLITVPANVADFTVTVAGAEDSVLESNETFTLTVGTQTATGTIENDDANNKPTATDFSVTLDNQDEAFFTFDGGQSGSQDNVGDVEDDASRDRKSVV